MGTLMRLGFYSGGEDAVWSCSKWLDVSPVGTVIRNGCDISSPLEAGVWFVKVVSHRTSSGTEWAQYSPKTGQHHLMAAIAIEGRDIFLPVQKMTPAQCMELREAGEQVAG